MTNPSKNIVKAAFFGKYHDMTVFAGTHYYKQFARALCCTLLITSISLDAQEADNNGQVIGDVGGAVFTAFPIAIPDFQTEGLINSRLLGPMTIIAKIVRSDLALSGVFQVLDKKSFIDTDGARPTDVRFADWSQVGANALLKTIIVVNNKKKIELTAYLYDVGLGRLRFQKTYQVPEKEVRHIGHTISNDIYENYTKEPGVFTTRIAAVKRTGGAKHIVTFDVDGQSVSKHTNKGIFNLFPAWSRDGQKLLFTSLRDDNPDLYQINLSTKKLSKVSTRPGLNIGGKYSPISDQIALTLSKDGNSNLYIIKPNGQIIRQLTKHYKTDTSAAWSPDGGQIVFVSSRRATPDIYLLTLATKEIKRLTFQGDYHQTPTFSPRGDKIAFTSRDEYNVLDIFIMDLLTGDTTRLTQNQGNNEEPTFSPNGNLIAFTSDRAGQKSIYITTLDGKVQTRITKGAEYTSPSWRPFK